MKKETDIWLSDDKHSERPAVLLFHSFTSTPVDFKGLAQFLNRQGYPVYAPTLPGHGKNNILKTLEYGIDDWQEAATASYNELKNKTHREIAVFGLSLGGILATERAIEQDPIALGTFSSPLVPDFDNQVPYFFDQYVQFEAKKRQVDQIPNYEEDLKRVLSGINNYVDQMTKHYSELRLPIFIAQGAQDEMIDPAVAHQFQALLTHADVSFHLYEEAPHVITTGRVGQQLRQDVLQFLEKI